MRFGDNDDFGDWPGVMTEFEGAAEDGEEMGRASGKTPFEEPVRDARGARSRSI